MMKPRLPKPRLFCFGLTLGLVALFLVLEDMSSMREDIADVPWSYGSGEDIQSDPPAVQALMTRTLFCTGTSEARSGKWRALRDRMVLEHPRCYVCGAPTTVIHHVVTFWNDDTRELDESSLIWYCDRCHLFVGHLGDFRSWNTNCWADSDAWHHRFLTRPKEALKP